MKNNSFIQNIATIFILASSILIVSYSGWNGGFFFDDIPNIVMNQSLKIQEFSLSQLWTASTSGNAGPLARPVSMFSFAIDSYLYGVNPYYFKITNSIIHIFNAILVFFLCKKIISLPKFNTFSQILPTTLIKLSLIISLIWAISPININSSLYIVQRMNELSLLFTLSGCLLYLHVRMGKEFKAHQQFLLFIILALILGVSALSKENGILLAPLIILLEFYVGTKKNIKQNSLFFYYIFFLLFLLPTLYSIYYIFTHYESLFNFDNRYFTLTERLLTQFRVLIYYSQQLLFPNIYHLSYFHDDFTLSTSLTQPFSTLLSMIFWFTCLLLSLFFYKKYPWLLFGMLWFFIGHSMESTVFPLEMVFEHRNYLPSFGLIFIIVMSGYSFYTQKLLIKVRLLFPAVTFLYIIILFIFSYISASIIGNPILRSQVYSENHPLSPRSQLQWGEVNQQLYYQHPELKQYLETAVRQYILVNKLDPNQIAALTNIILIKQMKNQSIENELRKLYKTLGTIKGNYEHWSASRQFIIRSAQALNPVNKEVIDHYFKIILNNPKVTGKVKALLHKEYADYLARKNGLTNQVIFHFKKFTQLYATTEARLYFLTKLLDGQRYNEAEKLLIFIDQTNTKKRYSLAINKLKKILDDKRVKAGD